MNNNMIVLKQLARIGASICMIVMNLRDCGICIKEVDDLEDLTYDLRKIMEYLEGCEVKEINEERGMERC